MSESDDKYPGESGRRRFVKGVVGGATLAGVGASGAAGINLATQTSGAGGGTTQAMAIENTAGPAPRGMPQIPIEIDDEGYLRGVFPEWETVEESGVQVQIAETEIGGRTYSSEWFQYCGVESYEGLSPDYGGDNYFHSGASPAYEWQQEAYSEGDRLHVDDFEDYQSWGNEVGADGLGKPATGSWRSQDTEDTLPIQVLRSERIMDLANNNNDQWLQASTQEGFIAWLNKCTHFCCVPGYKQDPGSAKFGAENDVYCPCHQSVYDPFSLVETLFVARPRPAGD